MKHLLAFHLTPSTKLFYFFIKEKLEKMIAIIPDKFTQPFVIESTINMPSSSSPIKRTKPSLLLLKKTVGFLSMEPQSTEKLHWNTMIELSSGPLTSGFSKILWKKASKRKLIRQSLMIMPKKKLRLKRE